MIADKHQRLLQIDAIILGVTRHAKITKNDNILSKKVSDEVDQLHTYKYESFLQIDTMILDRDGLAFPKFGK